MEAGDLKPFLNLPIPVVLLDAYFETVPCNCVLINNVQGAYLAARHLIRTCKTQPGYLRSAYPISNFAERSSGFYKAIRASGTAGETLKIYALVNTFAQARGATAVLITVDGKVLESGHEVYDYAIEPNN